MKRNKQNHRITKNPKLHFKTETIKMLASQDLSQVAGGFTTGAATCSSSYPICDPN
jgi:hypothetical protein